jgi:cyanophycinase
MMTQLATEKESAAGAADVIIPGRHSGNSLESAMLPSDRTDLTKRRPDLARLGALLLTLLMIACPAAAGTVVAVGGALRHDNAAVWSRLVALAGGQGARFVVFATASADPVRAAESAVTALEAHGAVAEHIAVAPRLEGIDLAQAVRDPELIVRVRAARGVFFTGGAQEYIVETLQPGGQATPLLDAIRDVLDRDGVIAGTSAGAAVMSRVMFRDPPDPVGVMKGALRPGQDIDAGLGFAGPDLFVDQHFLRRGRLGRMLPLMQSQRLKTGIGVEENSAAILRGHEIEAVGNGGVLFVDLSAATTDAQLGAFNVAGVRLTYLGDGDRLDLRSRAVTPAPAKAQGTRLDPRATGFEPSLADTPFLLDVLGDGAILRGMTYALDGPRAEVRGLAFDARPEAGAPQDLGFEFRFYRGPDTAGWFTSGFGDEAYTAVNVWLDVRPVKVAQPLYRAWQP